jgi:hypothetical protein
MDNGPLTVCVAMAYAYAWCREIGEIASKIGQLYYHY